MEGVTGPPPSMAVKSGISTIEDLSKSGGLHGLSPETSTVTTIVTASENQEVKIATTNDVNETVSVNSSSSLQSKNQSGKTIPGVAIVLVHNH